MGLLLLAVILLVAVLLRVPALFQPAWYLDEGIFAAIAVAWRDGGALYTDAWDNKPPGIFAVYALGWSTGLEMLAVRLLDLAAMLGMIVLVFAIARRAAGEVAGLVAAAVMGLLLGLPTIEGHIANTESFLIVFTSLGVLLLLRGIDRGGPAALLAAAGLAFGAAGLFKQVAAFDALAALVFLAMVYRLQWRVIAPFVAGLAALPLLVVLLFLAFGSFGDLWHATVTSLAGYREDSGDTSAGRYLVALVPMAIAVPYAIWLRPWRTRAPEALFVLWLAFTALAVSASGRSYPHYFLQMAPPFAIVAGLAVSVHRPRLPRASIALGLAAATLTLSHVLLGPWPNLAWNREPEFTRAYYGNFVDYARGDVDRTGFDAFFDSRAYAHLPLYDELEQAGMRSRQVFVWGDVPWLYVDAGLENVTRYTTLMNAAEVEGSHEAVAMLLREIQPEYVLVMEEHRASWEQVQPLLGDRYSLETPMRWSQLYRLVGDSTGGPDS